MWNMHFVPSRIYGGLCLLTSFVSLGYFGVQADEVSFDSPSEMG